MLEKNLNQRLLLIVAVLFVSIVFIYPPSQKLRPGLDIAGGASLIFEIDDSGVPATERGTLAEKVKAGLQRRVDPQGIYNLVWRVQGSNRIEVQMPLPPADAVARREAYTNALKALFDLELRRGQIEQVLRSPAAERDAAITQLARVTSDKALRAPGADRAAIEAVVQERERLLRTAAQRYDARQAARQALEAAPAAAGAAETQPTTDAATQPGDRAALEIAFRDADELYEDAVDTLLATNLNRRRFQEIIELDERSSIRKKSLEEILQRHPDLAAPINDVLSKHAAYRAGGRHLDSTADLKRLVRGAGRLEFRILAEPSPDNASKYARYRRALQGGQMRPPGETEYGWFRIDNPLQFLNIDTPAALQQLDYLNHSGYVLDKFGEDYYVLASLRPQDGLLAPEHGGTKRWRLTNAAIDRDESGGWCVRFMLDVVGGSLFEQLTRRNIGRPLCILVDEVAYSAPNIQSAINRSGQITGDFSIEKVQYLVQTMEGGTLPSRVKDTPLSERTIGSSLGVANRDLAIRSGLYGTVAVIALMLVYYQVSGAIAVIGMALNVLLTLSALALLNARLTLDGIAGIILAVGMAVDANVLIYERMREEKERGASFRMIIKNGYDKAFSTIFDSNITTLLTCVIIYYVGSEEVKGFGLTLGWGILLNLFTSVFVTRTLFGLLLKYNLIKNVSMLKLIGVPNIDWYGMRRYFFAASIAFIALGMFGLIKRGADALDVEFRGGIAAEVEISEAAALNDRQIGERLADFARRLAAAGERLRQVQVVPTPDSPQSFRVRVEGLDADALMAMILEPLDAAGLLEVDGVQVAPGGTDLLLTVKADVTQETLTQKILAQQSKVQEDARLLETAKINAVLAVGEQKQGGLWDVTTTVTNKRLVEYALVQALGNDMRIQPRIDFVFRGEGDRPYPITARTLDEVVPGVPAGVTADLTNFLGGAAMYFDQLDPPISVESLTTRLSNMHFQPDFASMTVRETQVIGVTPVPGRLDEHKRPVYSSVVVLTVDPEVNYRVDREAWWTRFAQPELNLSEAALSNAQTLRKVMQFKPQIADQAQRQAIVALVLAWAMIIGYVWIRFGRLSYGVGGVVALMHDVLVALSLVGMSGWLAASPVMRDALLIHDFKINMTIIAALLTIIGFSINDTIVIFDRIRETRGRLGVLTPEVINRALNETLSRTLLTSTTVFMVCLLMYIFGGESIRGFNFCMLIGVISGTYSTIAIATPILLLRFTGGVQRGPAMRSA